MLVALAWRNLARNLRRSLLTGGAVAFGVLLILWMRGLQDGSYDQMIDQAVRTRLGHIQVLPNGYLKQPDPELTVHDTDGLLPSLAAIEHVKAVSPRAQSEGMLSRDSEIARVDLLGVDPTAEQSASLVPERLLEGEEGSEWCHAELGRAVKLMGGDQHLFDRWCAAAGSSRYLPTDNPRAVVIGSGIAKRLLVSVGDEITVQVVRAVGSEQGDESEGSLSQRRLEVTGVVRTGNPEIDDRVAYLQLGTLEEMLGTTEPNEIVLILDDIRHLESTRDAVAGVVDGRSVSVHTWYERNPQLKNLIDVDSQSGNLMYVILVFLVALGVVNATLMSVLERVKEFGVMLALGMKRHQLFLLVMTEVAILGLVAVFCGALLGGGLEVFGRFHGWPLEWFGGSMEGTAMSGVVYEPIYYSNLSLTSGIIVLVGIYVMFLLAGLFPAFKASRLAPIEAMRQS